MLQIKPLGDGTIHIRFGEEIADGVFQEVQAFAAKVFRAKEEWMLELVPTYTSVTIFYKPELDYRQITEWVYRIYKEETARTSERAEAKLVKIPVCYGGEFGPDLDYVAGYHGLSVDEVIRKHTAPEYRVYMIGFMPGFPYLGGLDPELATPRLSRPRARVPKGSVGIAGGQTGLYPLESPGGWQLIGRTPLRMFNPWADPPTLLRSGDRVRFVAINEETYAEIEAIRS
ncbi:MAG: 5-oxoprolinase subunit PxpB [Desulfitobacteriaceae bacterium]|nr:5-oxoprolinase subunit PxpB [Desulfitobacteriaceae bacterium]MDI6916047.1 5-oxoprolinase subunit PxpB [Desulfitobacteriaceae bacterium]